MRKESNKNTVLKSLKERCLITYPISKVDAIKMDKRLSELTDDDQISIVSDAMFKTMLYNDSRKEFPARLISSLLGCDYEEVLNNLVFMKNELDKDSAISKGSRTDFLAKIGEDVISIEMNVTNVLDRNVEYLDRAFRSKVLVGKDYIYPRGLQLDINNFTFEGHDEVMEVYRLQNDKGELLIYKEFIQVYVPNLIKKSIILGIENLNEFERTLLVMLDKDKVKAQEIARGDDILEKYVKEANAVKNTDESLREAYDHEAVMVESAREDGFLDGHKTGLEEGIEKGEKSKEIEMVKKMLTAGASIEFVKQCSTLSEKEIEDICHASNK